MKLELGTIQIKQFTFAEKHHWQADICSFLSART